jgi:ubiquinone/menaquinone biosynthesis C-methylase UbiE
MEKEPFYKAHWRTVDSDRMSSYKDGFNWDEATNALYKPANISSGHRVVDFGCGPGKVSVQLAKIIGPTGHVDAIDINSEFLEVTQENARLAGVSDQITTHLNEGDKLPLPSSGTDRVSARNTIMYVDDPVITLKEFHRILRPGGIAHAIDGDWFMMVAEPVDHDLWRDFVKAASVACRNSDMGRKLNRAFSLAGFSNIKVEIKATADLDGRLMGMIRNMGKYAQESGTMDSNAVESVVSRLENALCNGEFLVVSPQFVVTGEKTG